LEWITWRHPFDATTPPHTTSPPLCFFCVPEVWGCARITLLCFSSPWHTPPVTTFPPSSFLGWEPSCGSRCSRLRFLGDSSTGFSSARQHRQPDSVYPLPGLFAGACCPGDHFPLKSNFFWVFFQPPLKFDLFPPVTRTQRFFLYGTFASIAICTSYFSLARHYLVLFALTQHRGDYFVSIFFSS